MNPTSRRWLGLLSSVRVTQGKVSEPNNQLSTFPVLFMGTVQICRKRCHEYRSQTSP
jgi:hypothetical protein